MNGDAFMDGNPLVEDIPSRILGPRLRQEALSRVEIAKTVVKGVAI